MRKTAYEGIKCLKVVTTDVSEGFIIKSSINMQMQIKAYFLPHHHLICIAADYIKILVLTTFFLVFQIRVGSYILSLSKLLSLEVHQAEIKKRIII